MCILDQKSIYERMHLLEFVRPIKYGVKYKLIIILNIKKQRSCQMIKETFKKTELMYRNFN